MASSVTKLEISLGSLTSEPKNMPAEVAEKLIKKMMKYIVKNC